MITKETVNNWFENIMSKCNILDIGTLIIKYISDAQRDYYSLTFNEKLFIYKQENNIVWHNL